MVLLEQQLGPDDIQRFLATSVTLWFCGLCESWSQSCMLLLDVAKEDIALSLKYILGRQRNDYQKVKSASVMLKVWTIDSLVFSIILLSCGRGYDQRFFQLSFDNLNLLSPSSHKLKIFHNSRNCSFCPILREELFTFRVSQCR